MLSRFLGKLEEVLCIKLEISNSQLIPKTDDAIIRKAVYLFDDGISKFRK